MKHPRWILLALPAALWLTAAPVAAATEPSPKPDPALAAPVFAGAQPTLPLNEVKKGQRGYGLSVFSGTEPERFEVEVIGVMRNLRPNISYILARLTGKGLEKSGVAAGMSGSPVFIDGRLAGAVAFSWPFSNEAVAGITPIDSMRTLSTFQPLPVAPPPPINLSELRSGKVPEALLTAQLSRLQPQLTSGAVPAVQWATSGFGELSLGLLRQGLGSVGAAGKAAPGTVANDLAPGKSVSVVLVDGDFELAANGTVTDHYGDHVLAFGHPFLGLGPVRVPMAVAEVVTVISSANSSFKISNTGPIVGAFEQDRQLGIQGRIGAKAPMVPMSLHVAAQGGEKARDFHVRLADLPEFVPLLVGSTVLGGIESASYATGQQSLELVAHLRLQKYGDLEVRQSFDSENAGTDAAAFLLTLVNYLTQNPLQRVSFESFDVSVSQTDRPKVASLVGANADRTVVRPGQRVTLSLDLVAFRGDRFRHSLAVDLPPDLPVGRYSLLVGDGSSIDSARIALEPADPQSFPQALALLRSFHSRRDLMVLGVYAGAGLSVAGEIMPRLPGSVRSLWGAAGSGSVVGLRSTIAQEQRERMAMPVTGLVRVDLEVRRKEPLVGADETPAPAAGPNHGGEKKAAAEKGI
ncbi:MAG: SpoIVB peptidase S55 domain-containing protein [Thermoanaerobaculia bacterium]